MTFYSDLIEEIAFGSERQGKKNGIAAVMGAGIASFTERDPELVEIFPLTLICYEDVKDTSLWYTFQLMRCSGQRFRDCSLSRYKGDQKKTSLFG